jgi:tRNA-2-methylthio-N6-dimethylallyladenosine synthase
LTLREHRKSPINTDEDYLINIERLAEKIAGLNYKYHIITYGCQMNSHDSEKLAGMLEKTGYSQTDDKNCADIILFNTCCVRDHAEQRVYGNIGMLKEQKLKNPNLLIGVCGCMMQQNGVADAVARKFPFVDLIFGTHNLYAFPKLLLEALDSAHTIVEISEHGDQKENIAPIKRNSGISAWVTIMYGCDNFCSYCIVPYVRGREKSRSQDDILSEINVLSREGFREVYLLGQNVNSYKGENGYLFHDLLNDINKVKGIERIRFISSHPKDLSPKLIEAFESCDKLCEHIHLPIQSGSNLVLEKMNRRYTREDYLDIIRRIRNLQKRIAVTTDIIAGFPGETEKDFEDTLSLLEEVRFDAAFTFMYSSRKGTPAADLPDQTEHRVKKERLDLLNKIQSEISKNVNQQYKDKVLEVMVEGISKSDSSMFSGRTRTNKLVNFKAENLMPGYMADVRITAAKAWTLEGVIV